jgi:NTE family protein
MAVERKGESKVPKSSNLPQADAGLEQTISEGSTVTLDGHGFTTDGGEVTYSWSYISHKNYDIIITDADSSNATFKAPYIKDDGRNGNIKPSIKLTFQLVILDNKGRSSNPSQVNVTVKRVQRAMIFQGGVAIGAYEAGVFQALVKKVGEEHRKKGLDNKRPLFDIVAGSSIGAWNAAVVLSNTIRSKRWEHSAEELISWQHSAEELVKFWQYQETPTYAGALDMNPFYHYLWDIMHMTNNASKSFVNNMWEFFSNANPDLKKWYDESMRTCFLEPDFWRDYFIDGWYVPANGEAARRYYSAWQCEHFGVPHVASGIPPLVWPFYNSPKFFDLTDRSTLFLLRNLVPRPDNKHLLLWSSKETLNTFVDFPIKTKMPDPRYLLVTIDVETGDAVTFDSYEKNAEYYSEYGDEQSKHTIFYENGIQTEHVLASGAFPNLFDYPKFSVKDSQTKVENEKHNFWDGNLRSSTPLREVIQAHRDYWYKTRKEDDVPDLEVYIADLWPSPLKEEPTSFDLDFVEYRKWNIIFQDKTDYDQKVANVVTDYNDLVKQLITLANRRGASDEVGNILEKYAHSEKRNGQTRKYKDLLGGRFGLTKVVRIDRKDSGNEVFDMIFDYSSTSIENLMKVGYCDALTTIGIQSIREGLMAIKSKTESLNDDKNLEDLEIHVQQIREAIKVGNGYDPTIINQIEDFIHKVESVPDEVGQDGSIKEEKAILVNAAKQFEETITETKDLNCMLPQTI